MKLLVLPVAKVHDGSQVSSTHTHARTHTHTHMNIILHTHMHTHIQYVLTHTHSSLQDAMDEASILVMLVPNVLNLLYHFLHILCLHRVVVDSLASICLRSRTHTYQSQLHSILASPLQLMKGM